jgi:hypothetical protein
MKDATQISAFVSPATKHQIDRYVRATGVKKAHLIEQALRHHLMALQELPADVIVHPTVVVTRKSGQAMLGEIENGQATSELRALMRD